MGEERDTSDAGGTEAGGSSCLQQRNYGALVRQMTKAGGP